MKQEKEHEILKEKMEKIKDWVPLRMGELLRLKLPKNLFLVEDLVPKQGLVAITGHPGIGKSWILLHIAQCVATGRPVFDKFKTEKCNVLIFDEESGLYEASKRIKLTRPRFDIPVYVFIDKGIKVDNPEHIERIMETIKENKIRLVIFDPFVSIHNKLENSSDEIQRVVEALRKLAAEGITVIFAHHNRKDQDPRLTRPSSQNMRGSSALWAGINSHLDVVKDRENKSETVLTISHCKSRNSKVIKPFTIKMVEENQSIYFDYIGESLANLSKREKAEIYILEKLAIEKELNFEALSNREIAGRDAFKGALTVLKEGGKIKSRKVESGKELFSITEPPVS